MDGIWVACVGLAAIGLAVLVAHRRAWRNASERFVCPPRTSLRFFQGETRSEPWTIPPPRYPSELRLDLTTRPLGPGAAPAVASPRPFSDLLAATADGAFAAAIGTGGVLAASDSSLDETIARVDHDFDGLTTLSSDGFGDVSEAAKNGYTNWLEGYLGETIAAHSLENSGHVVQLADSLNQPGWDVLVDGKPYQVKVGDSAIEHIHEHFDAYPDIPVITDFETAEYFADPMVVGVDGLDPEHLGDVFDAGVGGIHGAADAADGIHPGQHLHLHIPWFTLWRSSARELSILSRAGNEWTEAFTAIGVDAGSVVGGAMVGKVIGTLIHPGIGTIIGGALGGFLGRLFVSDARKQHVEAKLGEFEVAYRSYITEIGEIERELGPQEQAVLERWSNELRRRVEAVQGELERHLSQIRADRRRSVRQIGSALYESFSSFYEALDQDAIELDRRQPPRHPLLAFLFPTVEDKLRDQSHLWIRRQRSRLEEWERRLGASLSQAEMDEYSDTEIGRVQDCLHRFSTEYHVDTAEAGAVGAMAMQQMMRITQALDRAWTHAVKAVAPHRAECERRALIELIECRRLVEPRMLAGLPALEERWTELSRLALRARAEPGKSPVEDIKRRLDAYRNSLEVATARATAGRPALPEPSSP